MCRSGVGQRYPSSDPWEARQLHIPQGYQSAKGHPIGSHVDQRFYGNIAERSGVTAGLDKGRFIKTSHTWSIKRTMETGILHQIRMGFIL